MEIIRIPCSYYEQLEYLSDKDFVYVQRNLYKLCRGDDVIIEKSMRGGLTISIYREAFQMENKARAKKGEKRLELDIATLTGDIRNDTSSNQVKESKETEQKETESNLVATKVATLESYIKETFDIDFIQDIYNKYPIGKLDFQEECTAFVNHWTERSPNGKKQKWEMEKTFDPKLRFRTWMRNNKKWSNRVSTKPSGIGHLD